MADSPVITCPECKKKFKGKGDLAGKKIKCPLCSKVFVVPAAGAEAKSEAVKAGAAPAPGTAPAPAAAPMKFADDEEDANPNPYGVTALDLAPRCPNCAQEMEDEKAFICLYCGYNTLTREIGRTEKLIAHTSGEKFKHWLPGLMNLFAIFFMVGLITFFSTVVPGMVEGGRLSFLDHESLRMWLTLIFLSLIWTCGFFAYKRLILEPTPQEKRSE